MTVAITAESPDSPDARALIGELEAELEPLYPTRRRHGYSVEKLIRENVAFFVIRSDNRPAGCGGIQLFGTEFGELKRMYVRPKFRGLGLARMLIEKLAAHARQNGVRLLRLETGIHQVEAINLYERVGFVQVGPFGDYRADPLSRFYEMRI